MSNIDDMQFAFPLRKEVATLKLGNAVGPGGVDVEFSFPKGNGHIEACCMLPIASWANSFPFRKGVATLKRYYFERIQPDLQGFHFRKEVAILKHGHSPDGWRNHACFHFRKEMATLKHRVLAVVHDVIGNFHFRREVATLKRGRGHHRRRERVVSTSEGRWPH